MNAALTVETPRPVLIERLRLAALRCPADADLFEELAKVLETLDVVPPGDMDQWRWSALHQVIVARAYLVLAGELTAPDMSILVGLVVDGLTRYGKPADPVRDPTETDTVKKLFELDPVAASGYVAQVLVHASARLRDVEDGLRPFADPFRHARVALGTHGVLLDLCTGVAA